MVLFKSGIFHEFSGPPRNEVFTFFEPELAFWSSGTPKIGSEVLLIYRKVVPSLFDPPDRWILMMLGVKVCEEPQNHGKTFLNTPKPPPS